MAAIGSAIYFKERDGSIYVWLNGDIVSYMFSNYYENLDLSDVIYMDVSNQDASKVSDMTEMFYGTAEEASYSLNLSN